jgi:hypothetical protein
MQAEMQYRLGELQITPNEENAAGRRHFAVHKAVTNNGLVVPLHAAAKLSDGYLFDPRSVQAFEYCCSAAKCVRRLMRWLRYDHVVGVVRNTRALEDGEILAATEQERKSAQESCQQYAEANLDGGVFRNALYCSTALRFLRRSSFSWPHAHLMHPCLIRLARCCWRILHCLRNQHRHFRLQGQPLQLLVWPMELVLGLRHQRQQRRCNRQHQSSRTLL